MKSIAFKSKIENNKIPIPEKLFGELKDVNLKQVRVIVMMEEIEEFDDEAFNHFASQFFKKYASNLEKIKNMIDNNNKV
jgi:hypothetical protein